MNLERYVGGKGKENLLLTKNFKSSSIRPNQLSVDVSCFSGLSSPQRFDDVLIFHAGTKRTKDGDIMTSGGRVLTIVGQNETLLGARKLALSALNLIHFEGCIHRTDIAFRALVFENR